jgi:hypothetical protein
MGDGDGETSGESEAADCPVMSEVIDLDAGIIGVNGDVEGVERVRFIEQYRRRDWYRQKSVDW